MICHNTQLLGDVQTVVHSTQSQQENAHGVLYLKKIHAKHQTTFLETFKSMCFHTYILYIKLRRIHPIGRIMISISGQGLLI